MMMRKAHLLLKTINNSLIDMPSPSNITYFWNFGSLLGMSLLIQIFSGLFLSMHYSSNTNLAFDSISHISRNVNSGWMIRAIHSNGASMFFFLIFLHISRGMYYFSFLNTPVWASGIMILFLLMGTSFLGYILPWGQMSFWGATVITNLLTAIPYVGNMITIWIWGGFSVDYPTLTRFFSLHFILPFLLLTMVIIHILFLHSKGSSNPLGSSNNIDKMSFHPFFSTKDLLGSLIMLSLLTTIICLYPYLLSDPENFIPANPLVTPPHIQPEWYFLFAYAILRSIPNKLGGVMALFSSIIILLSLSFSMHPKFSNANFYPLNKMMFFWFSISFIMLTYLGACPVEDPYILWSTGFTYTYFSYFILMPLNT